MEPEDIRRNYDLVKQVRSVSWVLNMRPPPSLDGLPATEGLDCLIMVLRRIYSLVLISGDCLADLNRFRKSEADNPILAFSWLTLGEPEGAEACARAVEVKRALIEAIPGSTGSFANLWKSAQMNQTLWQKKLFHLYGSKYVLPSRPTDLVTQTEWDREEIADASIIQLNRTQEPYRTLQQAVDDCFGLGDYRTLYTPYHPRIIRVLYTPGMDHRLPFQALREFFLPRGEVSTVNGRVMYKTVSRVRYALIAVVRMRSSPQEPDSVRTYAICGANIMAECEPSYTPGSWLIEEPCPHNFALFFCLAESEPLIPEYPELGKAATMVDLEMELAIEDDMGRGLERLDLEASTQWAPRLKGPGAEPVPLNPRRLHPPTAEPPSSSSNVQHHSGGEGNSFGRENERQDSPPRARQTRGARDRERRRSRSPWDEIKSPRRRTRSHGYRKE
ncbi:hypothetical protein N0V84_012501 [Fusarium piperis]|uniref:Uncharacterized protein n=1 Tax=Fusarium piperis TaxID=1435070 RepID=A0A9W8W2N8_9HYPO|nr:hypothetical protein N0V84_012501 [Fusarium piperis]